MGASFLNRKVTFLSPLDEALVLQFFSAYTFYSKKNY